MKENSLNKLFLDSLNRLRSLESGIVHEISDLLDMDEVSIYRRLRGAVRFSVDEIGLLAQKYDISLDNLIEEFPQGGYRAWKLDLPLTVTDDGFNMEMMEENIPLLQEFVENEPLTETGGAIGFLTRHFFMQYRELSRFMLFRWGRYYSEIPSFNRFETVEMPERMHNLFIGHMEEYSKMKYTFYIWDRNIISNMVRDIQYFKSISLISEKERANLKEEIHTLLDDYEAMAAEGRYFDTENRFDLYLSPINIDTSQVYMRFGDNWLYSVEVYGIRSFLTFKPHICIDMSKRINNLKQSSTLISNSAEKERILFFGQQRKIVEAL